MIKAAICDDDEFTRNEIKELIENFSQKNQEPICIKCFENAEDLISRYELDIDIIFLDIIMKEMDGLQAAEHIRTFDEKVMIVFITSVGSRMREGYKVKASDFIIKPIHHEVFKVEIKELIYKLKIKKEKYIEIKNDKGYYKIDLSDIKYITIEKGARNITIHTKYEEIIDYRSLKEIETELKEKGFFRCHKSYITNIELVSKMIGFNIWLKDGEEIPVSKDRKKAFKEYMVKYLGAKL